MDVAVDRTKVNFFWVHKALVGSLWLFVTTS